MMIRLPRINQKSFCYALLVEKSTEYKTDKDGNVLTVTVNGKEHPIEKEVPAHYSAPIPFKASISMSGGEAEAVEFGIDVSSYSAIITTPKDLVPLTESSLVWFTSKPTFNKKTGFVDESSADYKVVKVSKNLNYDRYVLAKKVTNNVTKDN